MLKLLIILLLSITSISCSDSGTTTPNDGTDNSNANESNQDANDVDSGADSEKEQKPTELFFDFESGQHNSWGLNAAGNLAINSDGAMNTNNSLILTNRANTWDGPALTLTDEIEFNAPYNVSLYVKQSQMAESSVKLTIRYTAKGNQIYQPLSQINVTDTQWHAISGHIFIDSEWSNVVLYVEGLDAGNDVLIDEVHISQDPNFQLTSFSEVNVDALKAMSQMPIGVAVPAGSAGNSLLSNGDRQQIVEQHFSELTAENIMKASYLWSGERTYNFTDADALAQYAEQNDMSLHCHVAVWHFQTPNWLQTYQGEQSQWQSLLDTYVNDVTSHFGSHCYSWDVVNEAFFEDGTLRNEPKGEELGSIWMQNIGEQYLEHAFIAARASSPNSLLYYNDFNLVSNDTKFSAVKAMASDFIARGIPIDGIGLQMHITDSHPSIAQITNTFEQVVELGLKVKITELDIRLNNTGRFAELTPYLAERQKERIYQIVKTYFDTVPDVQRGGISVWGILDSDSWILQLWPQADWPLLFDNNAMPKPALQGIANAMSEKSSE